MYIVSCSNITPSAEDGLKDSGLIDEGLDYTDIYTKAELEAVANDLGGSYRLRADIDLSGSEFNPLGTHDTPFFGVFEGNNKTIRGLTINQPNRSLLGLFGTLWGRSQENPVRVQNLILEDASVIGNGNSGVLAGYVHDHSEISNVHIRDMHIEGRSENIGGMIGQLANRGKIMRSSAAGTMTVRGDNAGGLVGYVDTAMISESYTVVDITISSREQSSLAILAIGGLVGHITGNSLITTIVRDNYTTGKIVNEYHSSEIGGFIGKFDGYVSMQNNYSTVTVPKNNVATGVLIGYIEGTGGEVINGYYLSQTSVNDVVASNPAGMTVINVREYTFVSGMGLMYAPGSESLVTQTEFAGFDFTTVWHWNGIGTWPTLQWQH